MNHWAFVSAAYGLTALVICGLSLASYLAMRTAEKQPVSSNVEK